MGGKGSPNVPVGIDGPTRAVIAKISEASDIGAGLRGKPEDRYIRVNDLLDLGLAKKLGGNAKRLVAGANLISSNAPITDIPPKPENFETAGGIGIIFLTWDNPRQLYSNHSFTEIWRSETDDISVAVLVGQSAISFMFEDTNVDYTKTYYYWIRFVSTADIHGPWNNSSGTAGHCQQDPGELLTILTNEITESQLYDTLTDRIDLIDAPVTGLVDRVNDLVDVYGDTVSAAASAAAAIAAKTAAEIAEGNADAFAISAGTSASVATTKATAAATSATSAAGYSTTAGSAASAAASSATSASTSAGNASTSAGNASSSATSAAGSASTAGSSATAAATSATLASNSATAAAGSATTASTNATAAGSSASSASGSATSASTSAADALTYRNSASSSATSAAGSAAAAAVDYTAVNARLNNAGGTGVTVEQKLSATASDTQVNSGQYTVKIDNNGVITGFGLSSETVNGQTNSYFLVNADNFGIVNTGATKIITSLTRSGTTATANCTAHGYANGSKVAISSAYDAGWNGVVTLTSSSTNSFTFTVPSTLTTPANAYIRANGKPLSSLARSGTTATATFLNTPHNVLVGQVLDINSATQTEWNAQWIVTGVTGTTATFTVPSGHTTPATSTIKVAAQTIPFVVSSGKVVMDGAYIKDATITNAAIANATITAAKIVSLDAAVINVGTITTDKLVANAVTACTAADSLSNTLSIGAVSNYSTTINVLSFISSGAPYFLSGGLTVTVNRMPTAAVYADISINFKIDGNAIGGGQNVLLRQIIPTIPDIFHATERLAISSFPLTGRISGSPEANAGMHTVNVLIQIAFLNSSGTSIAGGSTTSASWSSFLSATENKV